MPYLKWIRIYDVIFVRVISALQMLNVLMVGCRCLVSKYINVLEWHAIDATKYMRYVWIVTIRPLSYGQCITQPERATHTQNICDWNVWTVDVWHLCFVAISNNSWVRVNLIVMSVTFNHLQCLVHTTQIFQIFLTSIFIKGNKRPKRFDISLVCHIK